METWGEFQTRVVKCFRRSGHTNLHHRAVLGGDASKDLWNVEPILAWTVRGRPWRPVPLRSQPHFNSGGGAAAIGFVHRNIMGLIRVTGEYVQRHSFGAQEFVGLDVRDCRALRATQYKAVRRPAAEQCARSRHCASPAPRLLLWRVIPPILLLLLSLLSSCLASRVQPGICIHNCVTKIHQQPGILESKRKRQSKKQNAAAPFLFSLL